MHLIWNILTNFYPTLDSISFTISSVCVLICMHLHIDKECKHSVLLVYIIFTNNRSTKIYYFFSILKTENHIKKKKKRSQLRRGKSFCRIYYMVADNSKKNKTTRSLCMHIKSTKDTYSPMLTHPHMLIHLNSFVLKF